MHINLNWKSALILICIVYTLLTITSSGYALLVGETTDTHFHLLSRFVVTTIGIGSILMFNLFSRFSLWLSFVLHYTVIMGIILIMMWVSGFFVELHPDAYRDIFLNFTPIYLLIAVGLLIRNKYKKVAVS